MPRTTTPKFPIVVTSYEIALSDARKHLRHYNWKYIVVDEVTSERLSLCCKHMLRLAFFNRHFCSDI